MMRNYCMYSWKVLEITWNSHHIMALKGRAFKPKHPPTTNIYLSPPRFFWRHKGMDTHHHQPHLLCLKYPSMLASKWPQRFSSSSCELVANTFCKWTLTYPLKYGNFWQDRFTSWWWFPTHLKHMLVKLDHFPKGRDKNKKCLKQPPRYGCFEK